MNHDDIRGALSAYAATTPDVDPRAGLPERLARRHRTRRTLVAVTACVAAVVAGTGVAALTRDTGGSQLRVADDEPSAAPSPEPTPSGPAEPTSHGPAPSATGVTEPSASESASPSPSPDGDDLYGGPVSARGRGEDGLRVTATLSRDFTPTATSVTLKVEATDDDGAPRTMSVEWGDGRSEPIAMQSAACPAPATTPLITTTPPPHPADITETFDHRWRNPASYVVRVRVVSAFDCRSDPAREEAVVSLTIDISPGRILSNGPTEPTAIHATVQPNLDTDQEHEWYDYLAEFSIEDTDGYVRLVTIDWGDGSKLEFVRNADDCADGNGRHFPTTIFARNRTHTYDPGEYTATLSWESAGCDGADVQRGRAHAKVVVEPVD